MSTIGSTPPPLHPTGFDPAGQVSLDEARQQGLLRADTDLAVVEATPEAPVDPGEAVLSLSAWDSDGARTLPRSDALEGRLAQLDRSDAANEGVDEILASF